MDRIPSPEERLRMAENRKAWRKEEWAEGLNILMPYVLSGMAGLMYAWIIIRWLEEP